MKNPEIIIHSKNYRLYLPKDAGGNGGMTGAIPRDYSVQAYGSMPEAPAAPTMDLIPTSDMPAYIAELKAKKALLSDWRMRGNFGSMIPSRNQGQKGYCWAHSTTAMVMMLRAILGMPYADLSAYAVACVIKGYRDEGGWCGESLKFLLERGVPTSAFWAQQSMDRSNDKPATWENAALHKVTEGFYDLVNAQIWNQKQTFQQVCTNLILGNPSAGDFNWWGHSVCLLDVVDGATQRGITRNENGKLLDLQEFDMVWGMENPVTTGLGIRILNSWGDNWGDQGMSVLTGNQAIPDAAVTARVTVASAA